MHCGVPSTYRCHIGVSSQGKAVRAGIKIWNQVLGSNPDCTAFQLITLHLLFRISETMFFLLGCFKNLRVNDVQDLQQYLVLLSSRGRVCSIISYIYNYVVHFAYEQLSDLFKIGQLLNDSDI